MHNLLRHTAFHCTLSYYYLRKENNILFSYTVCIMYNCKRFVPLDSLKQFAKLKVAPTPDQIAIWEGEKGHILKVASPLSTDRFGEIANGEIEKSWGRLFNY